MRITTISILFFVIFSACSSRNEIAQWRGPERTGVYHETNLITQWPDGGPKLVWRYDDLSQGYSSAAVISDKIFITGMIDSTGYLYSLDLDGELLWKKAYGPEWNGSFPGTRSTPLIYNDKGYLMSSYGVLYCFDLENGKEIWKRNVYEKKVEGNNHWGICENLIIDNDILFCTPGGFKDNVFALDRNSGQTVWKSKAKGENNGYCSPIIIERGGNKFYINKTDSSIFALNTKTGQMAWSYPLSNKQGVHANTPIYSNGMILVQDGFEAGSFMLQISDDGMSVKEVWNNPLLDETNGHSVLLGQNLYISAESKGKFCCVDWNTGNIRYFIKKYSPGTVISAEGLLYCYSYEGDMGLLQPADTSFIEKGYFKYEKIKELHISHPVIKSGRLYIRFKNSLCVYSIAK
jgi:outer membrane protein assembly factor BamB